MPDERPVRHLVLSAALSLGAVALAPSQALAVGANTPFWTLEAESGVLGNGAGIQSFTPGSPIPSQSTPAFEASGRAFVSLVNTGESVTLTNTNAGMLPATTIVVRNCIPDAPAGGGITATLDLYVNGVFRQALTFSSAQSWVYETDPTTNGMSKVPSSGNPHHFWNEARAFISGAAVPAGATLTLQKDAANTAAFYDIDCVDLEDTPGPLAQPANSLSITTYGAVSGTGTDQSAAIQNCMNAASSQGKSVWIPEGVFTISNSVTPNNITVSGAGMWYSEIYCLVPLNGATQITPIGGILQDLSEDSNLPDRSAGFSGINITGNNWTIQRVWVFHGNANYWCTGVNGMVQDCRSSDSWADGINLNNNNGAANGLGVSLTAQNNFIRGTDDDCITINSQLLTAGVGTNMLYARLLNNTTVGGIWGNGLRIAGGTNDVVQGNLISDNADQSGLIVGCFGPGSTAGPTINALVTGNTIVRGSGLRPAAGLYVDTSSPLALSATITGNTVLDSLQGGALVGPDQTETALFIDNVVNHPATYGYCIAPNAAGSGNFQSNIAENLNSCQLAYENLAPGTFSAVLNGNSFTNGPGCTGVYYASLAALSGTAALSQDSAAANGYEIVDMNTGSTITFSNVIAGCQLTIGYCTENNPGKMSLYVNGTLVQNVTFPDTGSWSGTYSTVTVAAVIPAGATVVLQSNAGDSGVNFDYIQVIPCGTPTPTASPSPSVTRTATPSATLSNSPSRTPSPTLSATPTLTLSNSPSRTPSQTLSATPSLTLSSSPSRTPSPTLSATPTLTLSGSPSRTPSPTLSATPSLTLSSTPSLTLSGSPSRTPSPTLSATPSLTLSGSPSRTPSPTLSATPSLTLSSSPSRTPSPTLSATPSLTLTNSPSRSPSVTLTATPSLTLSFSPTRTDSPTLSATPSLTLTSSPSPSPSATLTATPSLTLSTIPSTTDSATLSATPTGSESRTPEPSATESPTASPSALPDPSPTASATAVPTPVPSSSNGPGTVIKTVAWPNPNPQHIAVELSGPVSSLTIEIFSEDLDLVAEFSTGAEPGAWTELGLPSAFLATAPAGTYFYRVMVGTQTHGGAIGRFVLTK